MRLAHRPMFRPVVATSLVATVLVAVTGVLPAAAGAAPPSTKRSTPISMTMFKYIGAPQWFTVPANVDSLFIQAVGGSGGKGISAGPYQLDALGGAGGQVLTQLAVTPGEVLQINVGGKGFDGQGGVNLPPTPGPGSSEYPIARGGWNGGADAGFSTYTTQSPITGQTFVGNFAGGGGGASDVRSCGGPVGASCVIGDRIVVAGGGGGAGMDDGSNTTSATGGAGGVYQDGSGAVGSANTSVPSPAAPFETITAQPGGGASSVAPGLGGRATDLTMNYDEGGVSCDQGPAGGDGPGSGNDGTLGAGGSGGSGHYSPPGGNSTNIGGGGGGGGYFGGGGGGCGGFFWAGEFNIDWDAFSGTAGGGGGSSWVSPSATAQGTTPAYGIASVYGEDGYVVIQGMVEGATGASQAFSVPQNVSSLTYGLVGAQGASYGGASLGGRGATVTGTTVVAPGQVVQLNVGAGGETVSCAEVLDGCQPLSLGGPTTFDAATNSYRPGTFAYQMGWNGGGLPVPDSYLLDPSYNGFTYPQAGGGGASDLRLCPSTTSITDARSAPCPTALAIAAGGGGASIHDVLESGYRGGAGGCAQGGHPENQSSGGSGWGGSQTSGGRGGHAGPSGSTRGHDGRSGRGGDGGSADNQYDQGRFGSGGGGGAFGGGGGGGGGSNTDAFLHTPGAGGGGASLVPTGASCRAKSGRDTNLGIGAADGQIFVSLPVQAPGQPTAVTATDVDGTSVQVDWQQNGAFGGALTGAQIEYSSDAGQSWSTPLPVPATGPSTVTGLTPLTAYTFRVTLQNAFGSSPTSAASNTAWTGAVVPNAPTDVTATPGAGAGTVSWAPGAPNSAPAATSFLVTASPGGGSCTVEAPTSTDQCTVVGLTPGLTYTFTVSALNGAGSSPPSSTSNPVVATVAGPTALRLERGVGQLRPFWSALQLADGLVLSYEAVAVDLGGARLASCTATRSGRSCYLKGLPTGTTAYVTVTATVRLHDVTTIVSMPSNVLSGAPAA